MADKTQPERQRRYRARLQEARNELPALQSRVAELEAENAELRRRLAEHDAPPQGGLLDKLSPRARAEFDRLHAGKTLELVLLKSASAFEARKAARGTGAPARDRD